MNSIMERIRLRLENTSIWKILDGIHKCAGSMEHQNNVWIMFYLGVFLVMIKPMEPDRNGSEPYEKMFEMFMAWVQGKDLGL